jgi:signal transduction histidine kinase
MSGSNIDNVVQITNEILRYESLDDDAKPLNLVYVTQLSTRASDYLLFTIFPLTNITLITSALARFNMIIFAIALFLVSILYFFYFKRISVPLIEINNATRRFASLDFTPIKPINSEDEIGELSKNINILSANLSNAMSMLNDQNQVLSQQLESEQQREQQRKDFVAGVSHELKTPLAIIQATYEAIKEGLFPVDELPEHYTTIENEIRRANRIIQEMMQVYRFDQGAIALEQDTISVRDLLQANHESYQPLLEQANLTLKLSADDSILTADEEQFQLVISNLLSNAIKYATPSTNIDITWSLGNLQIQNHTTMTEDHDLDRLVEPFYRSDKSRSRTQGSTGLGLYIVKQIIELHHFQLKISMKDGVFTVSINTNVE